jgi:hypothetical protein
MDAATILVTVLIAGGIALLVWFEVNSRRNGARKKQMESSSQLDFTGAARRDGHSEGDKTKAA